MGPSVSTVSLPPSFEICSTLYLPTDNFPCLIVPRSFIPGSKNIKTRMDCPSKFLFRCFWTVYTDTAMEKSLAFTYAWDVLTRGLGWVEYLGV